MSEPHPAQEDVARAELGDLVLKPGSVGDRTADFGILVAPESRDGSGPGRIELPVVRIHSKSTTAAEPVFLFEGGPGLSNIKEQQAPGWLLEHHDVVMVGYRGVDGSVSLRCPELTEVLKSPLDPLSAEGLEALAKGLTAAARRLRSEGIALQEYSVLNVVDDVEDARHALGYDRVNLSGGSYGGAVVCAFCARHPQSVHRAILTEAAFPFNVGLTEPESVDRKLLRLNALWKQSSRVADSPDIVATLRAVLKTLPQQWNGVEAIPGKVKLMTFLGLYTADLVAQTFDAFVAAEGGDYSGLAFMSMMWNQVVDWFNWGDLCAKTYSTYVGPERDYESELDPPESIIGSPLSKLAWAALQRAAWRPKPLPEENHAMRPIAAEALLIYGSQESVPQEYVPYFTRGNLVVLEDLGHMEVTAVQPEAAQHLQGRFLLEGEVDTSLYRYLPQPASPFVPAKSYQAQAREMLQHLQGQQ